jgi:hypothetical protein
LISAWRYNFPLQSKYNSLEEEEVYKNKELESKGVSLLLELYQLAHNFTNDDDKENFEQDAREEFKKITQ